MTGLALELRRGPGKWLSLPLVALGVFFARQYIPSGLTIWPLVVSALSSAMFLMGPVGGGVAAFAGTRSHRRNTNAMEVLASRGAAAAGLVELGALLAWTLAAFTVVVAAVYLPAAASATWSGPDALRTIAAGLGLQVEVVVGYIFGRLVPRRLTPLVVALLLYWVVAVNNALRSGFAWSLFLPVNQQIYDQFDQLNHAAAAGQLLWYVGIGGLVTVGWVLRRQGATTAGLTALAATTLVTAAGVAVLIPQHGHSNLPGVHVSWDCQGSSPQICLHPSLKDSRPAVTAALTPVTRRLADTPFAVRRAEQRPRGLGSVPTPGAVAFALDNDSPGAVRLAGEELAVNSLVNPDACFADAAQATGSDLAQLVAAWAAGDPGLYAPTQPGDATAQKWFMRLTDEQRRSWLADNQQNIRHCTLTPTEFR